ncbi:Aspyridones efflux protein apdF [Fusarium oxysporum f. sp. cubense]|uniref:Aspyridones efflux protein apdF n=1 Tax=Fusarium oxysporum f. sp. cubense TaxID=61366 RepID=A0A559LHH8_FUSOC|nr:Aspyridones efflux protein apdF [Fusarium oxysporum f. sp. cubense]
MCGSCTGGLIYSSILRQLISSLGFPWTIRFIALIQFVTLVFANICLRPKTSAKSKSGWVDWTAFRDVRFNHYAIATFMSLLGLYISIFFIVDFSRTSISPPLSYRNGLSLLMIFNGVNAIGRFGSGLAADKFGVLGVFVPVLVATSLTLFTWISVRTVPSMYFWTVFCGIFCGGIQSLFPAWLGYLTAGTEQPGTRMGMVFGLGSIASLIGRQLEELWLERWTVVIWVHKYLEVPRWIYLRCSWKLLEGRTRGCEWLVNMERNDRETSTNDSTTVFPSEFPDFRDLLDQPGFSDLGFSSFQSPFSDEINPQLLHPVSGIGDSLGPGDSPEVNSIPPFGPTETLAPIASNVRAEASTISNPPPKTGKRLSLNSVRILNKWLSNHTHHPYPSVRDVEAIERQTGLTRQQILNWFANARRRKKFNPPETTDPSSAEASPRDIPLRRPPTPTVQQSPLERWENSPPEDEPSTMAAIARAVSGASGSIDQPHGTRTRRGRAPSSTGTWATTDTSDSSRSSQASGYSHTSNRSLNRVIKKRRRGGLRTRNDEKRGLSVACHRFQCTFCTETFKLKHTWSRHEKTQHLSLEQWECSPLGPTALNEGSETVCVYCGFVDPDNRHFEEHNHDLCHKRERGERVFYRKDHLRQHLRLVHRSEFMKWPMEEWKSKHEDVMSRCGFCDIAMTTWSERVNHLAEHFKEGRTMADWKGNWGFDAATLDMVENHMPPYLIDYERNSPLPFSTQQGAPYSSTSAFELLQLELDYFYANYTDINHSIPSDETLHFEACCIIFGAEMNYQHPSTATSWLRDLIMGTQDIVNKARMTPMKSAARSRFSELKIHSKKDIFEDCKLETSLRQCVDMLQLLNLEIGDVELQKEACSIINHMPDASPMFSQLLIGLVYGSTSWLASFRERVGLPPSEVVSSNTQEGLVPPLLSSGGLPAIPSNDHEHWRPPSGSNSPPISLGQKIVSLNDGNMYRGLTRDLTRYVARTISPLNPTSHIPTDEELQYQARWIMYDSHDVWNQTPADNLDWLTEFKRDSGFF